MARERIRVIGGRETVLGFSLLGIDGESPASHEDLVRLLQEGFADPQMALILIEDRIAAQAAGVVSNMQGRKEFPLVVEIPGPQGAMEQQSLRGYIAGAIGMRP